LFQQKYQYAIQKGNEMTTFANAVQTHNDEASALTENGMNARANTAHRVLDLFSKIGSARGDDLTKDFTAAFVADEDLTMRTLLWARDIREGLGERQTFRNLLRNLEKVNPAKAGKLMPKIPFLGRWDDLFSYEDPINRKAAFDMIKAALDNKDGLAAKWCPRKGKIAIELTKHFGLSPRAYRKLIVGLTSVVETKMCAKEWDKINFSHVPSVASARYQKAFGKNSPDAYSEYLRELQKPTSERKNSKVKINAGAVYPYDVLQSVIHGDPAVADEQWKALPNFLGDSKIIPIVDTSGSMGNISYSGVNNVKIAVSLGLYLSDKNSSAFKDIVLTFSTRSEIIKLSGTLSQRIAQINTSKWGLSTNLHAAFDNILDVAISYNVDPSDMPEVLLILSDMQFDAGANYNDRARNMIARKYKSAGYKVPKIVFWNLNAGYGSDNTPVRFDDKGTALISGFSPSIMKSVLADDLKEFTPYSVMLKTLMNERYAI